MDAAYAEYVRRNDYESGIELVSSSQNVVMTRTFSKIHGLAALRLGWMYGPAHVVDAVNRVRGPFNVNSAVMMAGIAAIEDTKHQEKAREHNTHWLAWLLDEIAKLGLKVTPSVANFLLIHFPDTKATAKDADAFLTKRGLILRYVAAYKLLNALRLTVGGEEANRLVAGTCRVHGKRDDGSISIACADRCRPDRLIDRARGARARRRARDRCNLTLDRDAQSRDRTWIC